MVSGSSISPWALFCLPRCFFLFYFTPAAGARAPSSIANGEVRSLVCCNSRGRIRRVSRYVAVVHETTRRFVVDYPPVIYPYPHPYMYINGSTRIFGSGGAKNSPDVLTSTESCMPVCTTTRTRGEQVSIALWTWTRGSSLFNFFYFHSTRPEFSSSRWSAAFPFYANFVENLEPRISRKNWKIWRFFSFCIIFRRP